MTDYLTPAVEVRDLCVGVAGRPSIVRDVSFQIGAGEMLGLVGESGSGKTMTGNAIAGLLPEGVIVTSGEILVGGEPRDRSAKAKRVDRSDLAMIFQNPMTSLNPTLRIGDQIAEVLRLRNRSLSKRQARAEAIEYLGWVGIPRAAERAASYPFEFSGGMRQRVVIAIALASDPKVLIADEPTTALDVTVQKEILSLIDGLRTELSLAVLLISHDLAVVGERCDRVQVMYAGELVESGSAAEVLGRPRHPYVRGLLRCTPEVAVQLGELQPLPGRVPAPHERADGCWFAPRCAQHIEACDAAHPELVAEATDVHAVRCIRSDEMKLVQRTEAVRL